MPREAGAKACLGALADLKAAPKIRTRLTANLTLEVQSIFPTPSSKRRAWNLACHDMRIVMQCVSFFKSGLIKNGYGHNAKHPGDPHKDTSTNSNTPAGTARCRRRGKDTGHLLQQLIGRLSLAAQYEVPNIYM
jgi:hypothetical protein